MNERVSSIIHHGVFVPALTGVSAFAAGVGLGYILGRRRMEEIEEVVPTEDLVYTIDVDNEPVLATLLDLAEAAEEDIRVPPPVVIDADRIEKVDDFLNEILTPRDDEPEEPEVITRNVFAADDENWNYEEEKAKRSEREPYILHRDEFYAEENFDKGYSQPTLTYYAGDDVLVDEDYSPIMNYGNVTGDLQFGHGSGDPNVVYIRNDQRNAEYEIIREPGMFSQEILGADFEQTAMAQDLKHSHSPRRMRPE